MFVFNRQFFKLWFFSLLFFIYFFCLQKQFSKKVQTCVTKAGLMMFTCTFLCPSGFQMWKELTGRCFFSSPLKLFLFSHFPLFPPLKLSHSKEIRHFILKRLKFSSKLSKILILICVVNGGFKLETRTSQKLFMLLLQKCIDFKGILYIIFPRLDRSKDFRSCIRKVFVWNRAVFETRVPISF